jgi:hypothetical protein
MKIIRKVLKIVACLFGGVVAASVLFLVATLLVFGLHDADREIRFIRQWIPFVWFFGAVLGGIVVYRSERSRVQRV